MGRKSYWTYILASRTRVLYIGVTNNLNRRLAEHRAGVGSRLTSRTQGLAVWPPSQANIPTQ